MSSPSASTAALIQTSRKDYSNALAELSTSYGFASAPITPTPAPRSPPKASSKSFFTRSKQPKTSAPPSPKTKTFSPPTSTSSRPPKDYARAFSDLSMSYGIGGGAPILPTSRSS